MGLLFICGNLSRNSETCLIPWADQRKTWTTKNNGDSTMQRAKYRRAPKNSRIWFIDIKMGEWFFNIN